MSKLLITALNALPKNPGAIFEPPVLAEIKELRQSDLPAFARLRDQIKKLKVPMNLFDEAVATKPDDNAGSKKQIVEDLVPWPNPVDGEQLLDDMVAQLSRYTVADDATIYAAALWCLHTYCADALTVCPLANITAPEKRCGKSVLMTGMKRLSYRALSVSNVSAASLFRILEKFRPLTLCIDEVDSFLTENEQMRGLLNAGIERESAYVVRCDSETLEPTIFNTFGPKILSGIGRIAGTLQDRSIPLVLRRKRPGEKCENIRRSNLREWSDLRRRALRWSIDFADQIAAYVPAQLPALHDRAQDCWDSLLTVAAIAGPGWKSKAQAAALSLSGNSDSEDPSTGTLLLGAIREVFNNQRTENVFTKVLIASLVDDSDGPWANWNRGRPISAAQISKHLEQFQIKPGTVRIGPDTSKGYRRHQFEDAWSRYLPVGPNSTVTTSQGSNGAASRDFYMRHTLNNVTDENELQATDDAGCDGVTDELGVQGEIF